jgi:hypothetical protein
VNRRHVLLVLLVALAAVGATAGYWFLSPQQVSVEAYYTTSLAGTTVAVFMDGAKVGGFLVPATPSSNESCIMFVGCPKMLGDAWLAKGLHGVRVTVNGATVLDQPFTVTGRSYAWAIVYWDSHADFGIGANPPGWL